MDLHKLAHEVCEAVRHWHMPVLVGLISSIKLTSKISPHLKISDLGDVPGDNILQNEILISFSSRGGL